MLDDKGVGLNDISAIEVVPGPGSFTSSRIGVAVANALAFGLNIPVNGHLHEFVKPVYDRPANITMSKKLKSELDTIVDN